MTPAARRAVLLADIDVVVDVGANQGQYASWLRSASVGFARRIISFEPTAAQFSALSHAARDDELWECHNIALGPSNAEVELNVSQSTLATSVFQPTAQHLRTFPEAVRASVERVQMRSLSTLWPTLDCAGDRVYLKIDVEGFELAVLEGAGPILADLAFVEVELSLAAMYSGSPLILDVIASLGRRGFSIVAIEPNGSDDHATGQMLMAEGIFRRTPVPTSGVDHRS